MTPPDPIAHSANTDGRPQLLVEHLRNVAELASELASPFGGGELAYPAGLWHDLGKFHPDWQEFIAAPEGRRGPDHSSAGAVLASRRLAVVAGLIAGHHGGLPDFEELKIRLRRTSSLDSVHEALEEAALHLDGLAPAAPDLLARPDWLQGVERTHGAELAESKLRWEFFLRFVFSALIDADFLDTERHFEPERASMRGASASIDLLWRRFEASHAARIADAPPTRLNRLRAEIYAACLSAADGPPGLYRLTVPTGGGKTLSGMGFALRHALRHDLRRIVVAIPYTSIIDQTAEVYRDIFGDALLEHHSAIGQPSDDAPAEVHTQEVRRRLASENWDAPIVVTTTVQLFESLFGNRTTRCRKLHNLAGSVMVIDEVQTLPFDLLAPIVDVLREITEHYRVTVVLCTATQPAVAVPPFDQVLAAATEIVSEPSRYFRALRRVAYEVADEPWSWERVAAEIRGAPRCLTIVNTKRDALAVLAALGDQDGLHLSTNLCGAHRQQVLKDVSTRLAGDGPCRLVSTQVVEAGVDLDFPWVLRALGPLDRIVQAAGRCNREGRLGQEGGRVVVFDPEDGGLPPGVYRTAMNTARRVLHEEPDLHDPAVYERYFRLLSQGVDLDRRGIQPERVGWNFATVAERFRLIEDDTIPVLVPYPDDAAMNRRIDGLLRAPNPRAAFRAVQPYLVTARRSAAERYRSAGRIEEILPGIWAWLGTYDRRAGLIEDEGLSPASLVV